MLEIFKLNRSWEWGAYGKHPVARDYFSTCNDIPILKAFSSWVEKGYQSLETGKNPEPWNTFRFWIKGPKKDLIMGILRDSSDSIGRVFPLLIIGTGALKNWEKNWERIPSICEKSWARTEYIACKRVVDRPIRLRTLRGLNQGFIIVQNVIQPPGLNLCTLRCELY